LPVAAPVGHPFTPFVVGDEGCGDQDDSEDGEKNLHENPDCCGRPSFFIGDAWMRRLMAEMNPAS